jgi:hypothetical protein
MQITKDEVATKHANSREKISESKITKPFVSFVCLLGKSAVSCHLC